MKRSPLRKKRPVSKQTLRKRLHLKLWKTFSQYVRKKSKGICFTCGARKAWQDMDASHYLHGKLDYSEINIQACCVRCNRYLHGNLGAFAERLVGEYGQARITKLRLEAREIQRHEIEWLQEKISYYEEEFKKLE